MLGTAGAPLPCAGYELIEGGAHWRHAEAHEQLDEASLAELDRRDRGARV